MANIRRRNVPNTIQMQTVDQMMDREHNRVPNAHEIVGTGINDVYRREVLNTLGDHNEPLRTIVDPSDALANSVRSRISRAVGRLIGRGNNDPVGVAVDRDTVLITDSAFQMPVDGRVPNPNLDGRLPHPEYLGGNSGGAGHGHGGGIAIGGAGGEMIGGGGGGGIRGVNVSQIFSDELQGEDSVINSPNIMGIATEGIQAGQVVSFDPHTGMISPAHASDYTTIRPGSPYDPRIRPSDGYRLDRPLDGINNLDTFDTIVGQLNQDRMKQMRNDEISMIKGALAVLNLEDTHANRELVKRKMLANTDPSGRMKSMFPPEEKSKGDRWGNIWNQ